MKLYSQIGQDAYFINNIINHKTGGFFVEVGAHNGISFSNTLALEESLGWNGVCIEADPNLFTKLKDNRKCICVNECVYHTTGVNIELEVPLSQEILEGNDMLIRIKGYSHNDNYFSNQFKNKYTYTLTTKTLTNILDEINAPSVIDYMSIDIEGAEIDCLIGLDHKKYFVKFLAIEWGYRVDLLKKNI